MLELLPALRAAGERFDALITDPPYCSGGLTTGERTRDPAEKYVQQGTKVLRPTFEGDGRDQRSWTAWVTQWLALARPMLPAGGWCLVFSDWRQLPTEYVTIARERLERESRALFRMASAI